MFTNKELHLFTIKMNGKVRIYELLIYKFYSIWFETFLTTVGDVHVQQQDVCVSGGAGQLLVAQTRLSSLLPQLQPADLTPAGKHHSLQMPAGTAVTANQYKAKHIPKQNQQPPNYFQSVL